MTRQTDPTSGSSKIWYANPSLVPGAHGEAELARRIAAECVAAGLTTDVTEVMQVQRRLHADGSIIRGAGCGALSDYRAIINRVTE